MKEEYSVSGRVVDRKTQQGIPGLRVEAWDKDLIWDDYLGSDLTDSGGGFRVTFNASDFRELFLDREPDLYFRVYRRGCLIASTEDSVLWNTGAEERGVLIEVTGNLGMDEAALARCAPAMARLLQMSDEDILDAKLRDDRRIAERLQQEEEEEKEKKRPTLATEEPIRVRRRPLLPHPLFGTIAIEDIHRRLFKIRALVDFAGNKDDLAALGIKVFSGTQNVFTVLATRTQLEDLAGQAATRRIDPPRLFFPTAADSVPTAEVDQIHALGTRGNGILVGVIDGVLHVGHHAFLDANPPNATRVRFLWVQDPDLTGAGAMPPGDTPEDYFNDPANPGSPDFTDLDYGRIYDADAIDNALGLASTYGTGAGEIAKEPDAGKAEHGTHVAGIAAGSGHLQNWASAPVNIGAAPLADIVHVNYRWSTANLQDGIWEDDILNALDFILRVADDEGRPVVINNSYSTHIGPHTGNTAFDQARNAMLDSHVGRSLVFTSGNDDNDEGFHKGTVAASGGTDDFDMRPSNAGWDIWVEIWYRRSDLDFKMDCGGATTGWVASPNDFNGTVNGYDIEVSRDSDPSGLQNIRLYVQAGDDDWTVRLRNNGGTQAEYWAWVGAQGSWGDLDGFSVHEFTIRDSACARSILTVGGCSKQVGATPETIGGYSGHGPTLDGRIKPEIVAVGSNVNSADSRTDGGYVQKTGTSMAAPVVSGAVALLLENDPDLNQDAIKGLLTQTADRTDLDIDPDQAGYDPEERNGYGFGRLRMLAPFQHSLPLADVDVWVRTAGDDYGFEPYPGGCFCHAPEVRILNSGGHETTVLNWGERHTVEVRVHNLGDTPAVNTQVRLKYTRPWAAPDDWVPCQDSAGDPIEQTINIPALDAFDLTFTQLWQPDAGEVPAAAGADWGDHFCLLVELDHVDDPLAYDDSTAAGHDPWNMNIKGTNNVALRNLHVH